MNQNPADTDTQNSPAVSSKMTIRDAIKRINSTVRSKLSSKDADTVRILEYVLEMNETGILQSLDNVLTVRQMKKLDRIIKRLRKDEPLEYIIGSGDFHGRRFYLSENTLIPRTETETLVDLATGYAFNKLHSGDYKTRSSKSKKPKLSIIDTGTGSGCIIISLALMLKEPVDLYASDISPETLSVAQKNISTYKLTSKITTLHGDLLEPFKKDIAFDVIVANLPYLTHSDMQTVPNSVKEYEPHSALDGGSNGTEVIERLLEQGVKRLRPGGIILLEVQPDIIKPISKQAQTHYPTASITVERDTFDSDRFIIIDTK